jgi:hypothetical protein
MVLTSRHYIRIMRLFYVACAKNAYYINFENENICRSFETECREDAVDTGATFAYL